MSKYFCKADGQFMAELVEVCQQYHRRLGELATESKPLGLTFSVLMVHDEKNLDADEILLPTLMHHGAPALAKVRAMPTPFRAHGLGDVELLVDGDRWKRLGKPTRYAVLDHELTHVELVFDDAGRLQRDDCGRPKVQIRPHDWQFGWFAEVAERHGTASIEVQQASMIQANAGQLLFPGMGEPA